MKWLKETRRKRKSESKGSEGDKPKQLKTEAANQSQRPGVKE